MQANREMGKDAVIMNMKTIVPKGIYRLFRKTTVEVTAAIDDTPSYVSKLAPVADRKSDTARLPSLTSNPDVLPDDEPEPAAKSESSVDDLLSKLTDILHIQKDEIAPDKADEGTQVNDNTQSAGIDCLKLIYNQLVDREVEERLANQIIGEVESKIKNNTPVDVILSAIYQKIVLKLGQTKLLEIKEGQVKFVFFIGPTGVGKTTTLAKIASSLKLKQKFKVAMLTADTYRIAAVEQLRVYSGILNIPLEILDTDSDITQIVDKFKGYDVVLVDTAGRSHKAKQQVADIERLLAKIPQDKREVYLVLSATTKYKDLVQITETYATMTDFRIIFTKLDETDAVGNIINIKMLTGAPLSYATNGQDVPNDISKIDPQAIAKQLMGGF
jgi:flagellar biosynthesis protein FlhF